jgi:hypothetical protein
MKASVILLISALLTAAAFYLVWMNRASEKIMTAIIPVAVAGLAGVIIAVFVFGGEPATTIVFPASFQYRLQGKMPANLPWILTSRRFTQSQFAPSQLFAVRPELFTSAADQTGQSLYHHFLQRAIIDWMGITYRTTWQVEVLQFDLPIGREGRFQPIEGSSEKSKQLSTEQVETLLEGNWFAHIHSGIPTRIALPPGTELTVIPPRTAAGLSETGEILLKNRFCSIAIKTQNSSYFGGVGSYKQLAGLSDDEALKFGTANYIVRITTQFDWLRSNHPKMALYRTWASQLAEGLRGQFDEQVIWSKTKEDFIFSQLKGQLNEEPPLQQTTLSGGQRKDAVIDGTAPNK